MMSFEIDDDRERDDNNNEEEVDEDEEEMFVDALSDVLDYYGNSPQIIIRQQQAEGWQLPVHNNTAAAASLPLPEEVFSSTVHPTKKRLQLLSRPKRRILILTAIVVLIAVVIGVSVAAVSSNNNKSLGTTTTDTSLQQGENNKNKDTKKKKEDRQSTKDEIVQFLLEQGVSSFDDLQHTDTFQHQAASWLANTDPANLAVPKLAAAQATDEEERQAYIYTVRYVMALNYFALGGDNDDDEAWPQDWHFLSKRHVCRWQGTTIFRQKIRPAGVFCKNHVPVRVHLGYNAAKGQIPTENGRLTSLQWLDFSHNRLSGSIPSELCDLHQLQNLTLSDNHLVESLPPCLNRLQNLEMLVLSNNLLTGSLPDKLSHNTKLQRLVLNDNLLTGDPTPIFNALTNLELLFVDHNNLEGVVDDNFLDASSSSSSSSASSTLHDNLEQVDLSNNNFTCVNRFPPHLLNGIGLPKLQTLDLSRNQLQGCHIPNSVTTNNNGQQQQDKNNVLKFLSLHHTGLSGNVPKKVLQHLVALEHLDLSSNKFGGSMHHDFGNMVALQYLFLSNNPNFRADAIPETFANLQNLQELSLRHTQRTGTLPKWLGSMSKLKLLDLGMNNFTQKIPAEHGNMSELKYYLVNGNAHLRGKVPTQLSNLNKLNALFLDGTRVRGDVGFLCDAVNDLDLIFIECNSTIPMAGCSCCKCCHRHKPHTSNATTAISSCSNPYLVNLDASWENEFQRQDYNFFGDDDDDDTD